MIPPKSALIAAILVLSATLALPARAEAARSDKLPGLTWWRSKVQDQLKVTQGRLVGACVFGDSISSGLGNTLGNTTYNFSMGGLSSVSLLEQLKMVRAANVQCQKAVIAIGTNDAWYSIRDEDFVSNFQQIIAWTRSLGAQQVTVMPAFYSTLEASYKPEYAGTLERVDEINSMIRQVAQVEQVPVVDADLQPLFADHALRPDVTFDGVHLNDQGKEIYRRALLKVIQP
jgi:lysophospholipase L1-like esterase